MIRQLTAPQAAQARAAGVRQRSHRPTVRSAPSGQRGRTAPLPASLRVMDAPAGGPLRITGVASVTGHAYEMWDGYGPYMEVIAPGAFAQSLNRADLDVPLVLGHDQMRRIARTTSTSCPLTLAETDAGLTVDALVDPEDHDVEYVTRKMRAQLIDEMSFAFLIVRGVWSPDYTQYTIEVLDIHRGDTAIVGYGANPATSVGVDGTMPVEPTDGADGCGCCPDCPDCQCAGCTRPTAARAPISSQVERARMLLDLALAVA